MKTIPYTGASPEEEWQGRFSKLDSLAGQTNSIVNSWMRSKVDADPVNLDKYDEPFSQEALTKQLGEAPTWMVSNLMEANPKSWKEFEKLKRWYETQSQTADQVSKNFSGGTQLLAGLTFGMADLDAALFAPMYKAGKALYNTQKALDTSKKLTLAQKWGLGAEFATLGAAGAAGSNFIYEATADTYQEGSTLNSVLLGAGLGGGLGLLATGLSRRLSKTVDAEGNPLDSKVEEAMKKADLEEAEAELTKMQKAYEVQKALRETRKEVQEKLKMSQKKDYSSTVEEVKLHREKLKEIDSRIKEADIEVKKMDRDIKGAKKKITSIQNKIEKLNSKKDESTLRLKEVNRINEEKGKLNKRLSEALQGLETARSSITRVGSKNASYAPLNAFIKQSEKTVKTLQEEISIWDKELNKLNKKKFFGEDDTTTLNNLQKEFAEARNFVETNKGFSKDSYKQQLQRERDITQSAVDVLTTDKGKVTYKTSKDSEFTLEKQQELDTYNKLTNDVQEFKKFLSEKDLLTDKIFRMKDKKFSLPGLIKKQRNIIQALEDDIKGVEATLSTWDKIKESTAFKNAPTMLQKFVISPIEKIYSSDNAAVRGFASLLHPGTLHHGDVTNNNTAMHMRVRHDRKVTEAVQIHRTAFKEAKKNGYKGSEADFDAEVTQEAYRINGNTQRNAREGVDRTLPKEQFDEAVAKKMESSSRVYTTDNSYVRKAADTWLDYYEYAGKYGKNLGLDDFANIITKGYIRRKGSVDKIEQMGQKNAVKKLVDAQKNYARDNNLPIDEKEFKTRAEGFVLTAIDRASDAKATTRPLTSRTPEATRAIDSRKILVYDDEIMDLLEDNIQGITETYKLMTHGRFALKEKLGIDDMSQMEEMFNKLGAKGDEKDRLRAVIQTIIGNREIPTNPYSIANRAYSAVGSVSSLMHIMSFGIPTLTEIAAPVMKVGFKPVLQNLYGGADSVYNIYKYGSTKDVNSISLLAEVGTHHMNHKLNRADIENIYNDTSKAQTFMNEAVRKGSIYGGLIPITDVLKITAITSDLTWLSSLRKSTISSSDKIKLEQMGFSVDDIPQLHRAIKLDANGKVDLSKELSAGDAKFRERLDDALYNFRQGTILHPDGSTLPMVMTDVNEAAFLSKIFFKFMRFPMESYERLLLNGIQHADANVAVGAMLNTAMWSLILTAKDAVKDDDKKRYEGDEGGLQLFKDSMMYNSIVAGPVAMTDKALALAGTSLSGYETTTGGIVEKDVKNLLTGSPRVGLFGVNIDLGDAVSNTINTLNIWNEDASLLNPTLQKD
jgi:hypothetical protein